MSEKTSSNRLKCYRLTDGLFVCCTFLFLFAFGINSAIAQEAPIANYSLDANGVVQLEVNSTSTKYYILQVRHHPDSNFVHDVSMTLGEDGSTTITEALGAYPVDHYRVLEHSRFTPVDTDEDGIDDITEYNFTPSQNPLNPSETPPFQDGIVTIDSYETFNEISLKEELVLDGKEFVKFAITGFSTDHPKVYFINMNSHFLHADFGNAVGLNFLAPDVVKGQVILHPTTASPNGTLGTYAFNYSNAAGYDFQTVQRTQELLGANMPFAKNNLSYFVYATNEADYDNEITLYQNSRVTVLLETNIYAGIDYIGLNKTEGYGFFRQVGLNEVPGLKEIALYDALPNSLPRVGGVITSIIQTPLSHVNLRAIQDNIPNAFIRDPLLNDSIADLLNHFVYFKTEQSNFILREATVQEVNNWYESIRPTYEQTPPLDLSYTAILSLDDIEFEMFDGFGAKNTNVATMRTFGFPAGTIPDGYGIPFYHYQEFMEYNNFFDQIETILSDPAFIADRDVRDDMLDDLRDDIEDATMPQWMLDELSDLQLSFPLGTSIRCRSSTNNEDLAGFSGAGLYDSKTHHPSEGHLSKTVKEIYASLWNLRAFEEREFYRINHYIASMGVLCHPNYDNEKVNGVGVSADPVYGTDSTFYLNSQLGEFLITNPNNNSVPEELLLVQNPGPDDEPLVIQFSDLVPADSLLLTPEQMDQLRDYLTVIHEEFKKKYLAHSNTTFAMDIEYKITDTDQLIIKQARPWVQYVPSVSFGDVKSGCDFLMSPNPASTEIQITCQECQLSAIRIVQPNGQLVLESDIDPLSSESIPVNRLSLGVYVVLGYIDGQLCGSRKLVKQ
ncbi:MAG: PEP/pyruvate-binding domain-containing protein [Crocinitomicaceae bacterium]|nr:PEP/pyruvate-binding domain-containing protein [Crocinitomicaceae bacterium]